MRNTYLPVSIVPRWPEKLLAYFEITVESCHIFNYDKVHEILPWYQYNCKQCLKSQDCTTEGDFEKNSFVMYYEEKVSFNRVQYV
jgi:hypothetical protein